MSVKILTPMGIEARALRAGAPWARTEKFGIGPAKAAKAARLIEEEGETVVIAGFCGALDPRLEPGDVVLASELRGPDGDAIASADPSILAGVLRRAGLRVYVGPIVSSPRIVHGERRRELAQTGALAVDMESFWLARAHGRPVVTLRTVSDSPSQEVYRPLKLIAGLRAAYRSLRQAGSQLGDWAELLGAREVILAAPRASCAGVVRAVEIVRRALEERGAPIYVRKQIVHNKHIVGELEELGAVFVEEVDEVPAGATVIYSAHGVSPAVREAAAERELDVIDATCPLVAKVHAETRRFARNDFDIVLIGHEGHEEVDGTVGEAPEHVTVIATADEIDALSVADPKRVAYLTQTTLAVDETKLVVEALRERFPALAGPASDDICYATQNRQDAVRALASDCDIVLVVGSQNSSNSRRLVEVAQRSGCPAELIEGADEIRPELLRGARTIGLTAGASAPEELVERVVAAIAGLGAARVSERTVATEDVHFKLPPQVRRVA